MGDTTLNFVGVIALSAGYQSCFYYTKNKNEEIFYFTLRQSWCVGGDDRKTMWETFNEDEIIPQRERI